MRLDQRPESRARRTRRIRASVLRDATAAAGIRFVHRRPTLRSEDRRRRAARRRAWAPPYPSADFDGDGWPDLYFTNSRFGEPNALYRNRGDGTFEDVAASAGLADLNRPARACRWAPSGATIDNDGREDVLVYRYGYLALFRNVDGRRFEDVTAAAPACAAG